MIEHWNCTHWCAFSAGETHRALTCNVIVFIYRKSWVGISSTQSHLLELQPFSGRLCPEPAQVPVPTGLPISGSLCPQGRDWPGLQAGSRGGEEEIGGMKQLNYGKLLHKGVCYWWKAFKEKSVFASERACAMTDSSHEPQLCQNLISVVNFFSL